MASLWALGALLLVIVASFALKPLCAARGRDRGALQRPAPGRLPPAVKHRQAIKSNASVLPSAGLGRDVLSPGAGVDAHAIKKGSVPANRQSLARESEPPSQLAIDLVDLMWECNRQVFAGQMDSQLLLQFQPQRQMLSEKVPTWFCPPLVIDARHPSSIYTADRSVELVVLQPIDTDENDLDDQLRVFLLPITPDRYHVLQVPSSSLAVGSQELDRQGVRRLLRAGYRSVGRDDLVDYDEEVPIRLWNERPRPSDHDKEYFSVAMNARDGANVAHYATGRLLDHVRTLRPRGAVRVTCSPRPGLEPGFVCLTFTQRYGTHVQAERQVDGWILSFEEELMRPPRRSAIVDITHDGLVLRVFMPMPIELSEHAPAEATTGLRIVDRRRFANYLPKSVDG